MTFYLLLLAILLILALIINPESGVANRRVFAVLAFGVLATPMATRTCEVGADTHQYCTYYSIIGSLGWREASALRYEPGFFLLNKVLYLVSPNPQLLVAVTSLIIMAGISRYIYSSGTSLTMSFSMFILLQGYAMAMTAMRQAIAIAIALMFVHRLSQRKPVGFVIAVLIASQFHASALVLLTLIPLAWVRFRAAYVVLLAISSVTLWWLAGKIFEVVTERAGRYSVYLDDISTGGGKAGVLFQAVVFVVILGMMSAARRWHGSRSTSPPGDFVYLAAWMILPSIALAYASNAYLRLTFYFLLPLAVGVVSSLDAIRSRKSRRVISFLVWSTSLSYFIAISYFRPEWFQVIPFESVLG